MNLEEFIQANAETLKSLMSNFFNEQCIINGEVYNLAEIEKLGFEKFAFAKQNVVPNKLYRFYPNISKQGVNHSIQALENNTVYMQSPFNFDDIFDSDITIDYYLYIKQRLIEYAKRMGIKILIECDIKEIINIVAKRISSLSDQNQLKLLFNKKGDNIFELENELFVKSFQLNYLKSKNIELSILETLNQEYNSYVNVLKDLFRIACFTTSPYSQLMWGGSYGNFHKGFCVEYTVLPTDGEYNHLFQNIFPLIYCKNRTDISEELIKMKGKEITPTDMWNIYFNGVLRKNIDWVFQNEWRLLLPYSRENQDFNIKFYPITKVYLGNRMNSKNRKQIIEICNRKNIPYVGVKKNPIRFEMQDCEAKCENCPQYLNGLENVE